ncbi:hypothetical protein K7X08_030055 [Anisodus acutangulus]|uniref:Uncharacterized protein n=1 Tax=Anisodus acutangulus TaxID=402998 RepID=A0A9Q1LLC9_9SOLA|nr:hypothetical protein K7X08_030055 [Anisodus acutangulus]
MEECLNTLVAYVDGKHFRRSEKVKKNEKERTFKEKVQLSAPKFGIIRSLVAEVDVLEPEKVGVHVVEVEKLIHVTVAKVEKVLEVTAPVAQVEKAP